MAQALYLLCSTWDLSSLIRDGTCGVPCTDRRILNHWITREVPPPPFCFLIPERWAWPLFQVHIVKKNLSMSEQEGSVGFQPAQSILHFKSSKNQSPNNQNCTPVFLPREFQGRGSLVSCHLWRGTGSASTEPLSSCSSSSSSA